MYSTLEVLTTPLPGKGVTRCNRMACQKEIPEERRFWNKSTRAVYCPGCARRINQGSSEILCIPLAEKDASNG